MFFNGRDWIRWSVSFIDCASVTTGTTEHNQNHLIMKIILNQLNNVMNNNNITMKVLNKFRNNKWLINET